MKLNTPTEGERAIFGSLLVGCEAEARISNRLLHNRELKMKLRLSAMIYIGPIDDSKGRKNLIVDIDVRDLVSYH